MYDKEQKKLVFVHPAIRPYRRRLFEILSKKFRTQFIFVEDFSDNIDQLKGTNDIGPWKAYPSGAFLFYSKGVTLRLLKDVFFGDYDVWVGSGLFHFSTHLALPFVKLRGKKFVLFSEDWWVSERLKNQVFLPAAKLIVRACDACVVASHRSRDFFIRLGATESKVFVGWNASLNFDDWPTNLPLESELRKRYRKDNDFLALYLGRVVEYKGLDILITALAASKHSKDISLLVGGEGDFLEKCRELSKNFGLKKVHFLGRIDHTHVPAYYRLADLFVLPAKFMTKNSVVAEAWGFTVNEALSCGLPVLTTTAVAAGEVLTDGKDGFVVPAGDVKALAEKLDWCFENQSQLKVMGQAARMVSKKVNPHAQFEAFEKAVDFVINNHA